MLKKIKSTYNLIKPFIDKINRDNVFAIAGQSAFFLLLSIVPLSMFVVSVLQNLHIPVETFENFLSIVLNETATDYVSNFLGNVYQDATGISLITIIVTLWSAAQGMHAITNGLNRIHGTYENRNWFFLRFRAMLYTVILFGILLLSMFVIVLGELLNNMMSQYLPLMPDFIEIIYNLRYIIIYFYLVFLFAIVYRNLPNLSREMRREHSFRYQLPGAVLCATAWFALSFGISIYVGDFNGFSIYGNLAKLAVLMVWLYFCIVCLLLGVEVNFFYHEQIKNFKFKKFFKKKK